MSNTLSLTEVEALVAQLPPPAQLKLVARVCEQLSAATQESPELLVTAVPPALLALNRDFWSHKTLEQLVEEQNYRRVDVDTIIGAGANLWESDADFEQFWAGIYERRREGGGT